MNKFKMKSKLLFLLSTVFFLTSIVSCDDTETTDDSHFTLYYSGMTDIGPSMTGVIASPSYIGAVPGEFEITKVTLEGELYEGESFNINYENGEITISNTTGVPVGLYKLSILCYAGGKKYEFIDIVEVNMMKPVPDGISVDPSVLTLNYADVLNPDDTTPLEKAQVVTDGNHVSITKYEIAKNDYSKYFKISSTGEISVVRGDSTLMPGKYVLSLKLTTGASKEDEGIFENAVEVDITSGPLALIYNPAVGKIEEETVLSGKTTFTSVIPELKGSIDSIKYSIKSVVPETDKIEIDPLTGVLSVKENHGFKAGDQYAISVNVINKFAPEGVNFNNVFKIEAVEFIEPISNFRYENVTAIQGTEFEAVLPAEFKGDEVRFELIDLPAELAPFLSIDINGKISAAKGNKIPLGTYTVRVKATNPKTNPEQPEIANFTLTVETNPNYFTYIRYGNNLNLSPADNYAYQYRVSAGGGDFIVPDAPVTDATVELHYEIKRIHQASGSSIDPTTGVLTVKPTGKMQCAIIMVTATAGKGTPSEYSVSTPVFFHYSAGVASATNASEIVEIEYSPFVLQVNPRSGGRSVSPSVKGVNDMSKFTLDYRRTFNYYNFFGNSLYLDGQPSVTGSFLQGVWDNYAASVNKSPNYGSRAPLSYYEKDNIGNPGVTLAYVDPNTYQVVVNPNKWIYNGDPANGAMVGQITFGTDGKDPASGGQTFPIVLWFDTNFK